MRPDRFMSAVWSWLVDAMRALGGRPNPRQTHRARPSLEGLETREVLSVAPPPVPPPPLSSSVQLPPRPTQEGLSRPIITIDQVVYQASKRADDNTLGTATDIGKAGPGWFFGRTDALQMPDAPVGTPGKPVNWRDVVAHHSRDVDVYKVEVEAGGRVRFDVETWEVTHGFSTGKQSMQVKEWAGLRLALFGADGQLVPTFEGPATKSEPTRPERKGEKRLTWSLEHTFHAPGTYYLVVSAYKNANYDLNTGATNGPPKSSVSSGPYRLSASFVKRDTPEMVAKELKWVDDGRSIQFDYEVRQESIGGRQRPNTWHHDVGLYWVDAGGAPLRRVESQALNRYNEHSRMGDDTRAYKLTLSRDELGDPPAGATHLMAVLNADSRTPEVNRKDNASFLAAFQTRTPLVIQGAALKDIDNSDLVGFSASPHPYFGGHTRVNGTLAFKGGADDQLKSVVLQVVENGRVIATGQLSAEASAQLLNRRFGPSGLLQIKTSQLLFEVDSSQFPELARGTNPQATLRVVAETATGQRAEKDVATVPLLVRYTQGNRYANTARDANGADPTDRAVGGDDWVLPTVRGFMEQVRGVTWGDMSNMNGGRFSPHSSHKLGVDADFKVPGYMNRDAATAQWLIGMVNNPVYGPQIEAIFVAYTPALKQALQGVTLNNGKPATSVIKHDAAHDDNFHVRWKKELVTPATAPGLTLQAGPATQAGATSSTAVTKGLQAVLLSRWSRDSVDRMLSVLTDAKAPPVEISFVPHFGDNGHEYDNITRVLKGLAGAGKSARVTVHLGFHETGTGSLKGMAEKLAAFLDTPIKVNGKDVKPLDLPGVSFVVSPSLEDQFATYARFEEAAKAVASGLPSAVLGRVTFRRSSVHDTRGVAADDPSQKWVNGLVSKDRKPMGSVALTHEYHGLVGNAGGYQGFSNDGVFVRSDGDLNGNGRPDESSRTKNAKGSGTDKKPTLGEWLDGKPGSVEFSLLWRPAYNLFAKHPGQGYDVNVYDVPGEGDTPRDGKDRNDGTGSHAAFSKLEAAVLKAYLGMK